MRTLVLARHAKAEAPGEVADHARSLTVEGREHAMLFGRTLAELGIVPDLVLASDSSRTAQTWKIAAAQCGGIAADLRAELYDTGVTTLLAALRAVSDDRETVVFVGHEPTVSAAAAMIAGPGSDRDALKLVGHGLSTGTAAVFSIDGSWAALDADGGALTSVIGRQ